ncbi:MAG: type III-A CRISPR-associated protein Csm2 [Candidatus Omnitrophica bacterium]|nr:type III-A CRISPR-associated protein Csm2 [Candidatus Omnitrophota bacterium]
MRNEGININNIKEIIINSNNKILNQYAEELAKKYAPQNEKEKKQKLTTSQIRNILDDVQRMRKEDIEKGKLEILCPKLAYVAGKNKDSWALEELRDILDYAIKLVENDFNKFENFRNFFEAIVGYHKFYSKVKD